MHLSDQPAIGVQSTTSYNNTAQLPPLRTSSSKRAPQRLQRPRPAANTTQNKANGPCSTPTELPSVKRQASKGRLLGLLGISKTAKAPRKQELLDIQPKVDIPKEENGAREDNDPVTLEEPPVTHNIRTVTVEHDAQEVLTKQKASKSTSRSKSFKRDPIASTLLPWDPPPLFQAYPQAVKHATLSTPPTSADDIIRLLSDRNRKRKCDHDEGASSVTPNSSGTKHNDDVGGLCWGDWPRKIFALVTSGYFLQYSGEGSFDRLPEKIMPVGKDSVAFASDAIPGKHWVLQVSHASDDDGTPRIESNRSFFKMLGFRSDTKRCSASNMLLVLDNPEELESWLVVVRKEIESFGGRKYQLEDGDRHIEARVELHQRPSVRQLVKRDPNQLPSTLKNPVLDVRLEDVPFDPNFLDPVRKRSTATEESIQSPSLSNATTSTDQNMLDRLRDSPRMSYISASAKTLSTFGENSPAPSPAKAEFNLPDFAVDRKSTTVPVPSTFTSERSSMKNTARDSTELHSSLTPSRTSANASVSASRTPSPNAPNFSVPTFSKRYSVQSTPPLPAVSSSSPSILSKKASSPPIIEQGDAETSEKGPGDRHPANSMHRSTPSVSHTFDSEPVGEAFTSLTARSTSPVHQSIQQDDLKSAADKNVPRRFSSLEYSRGISPVNITPVHLLSTPSPPHPPPTSALPALPVCKEPSSVLPSTNRKLRRPVSMQIHSAPAPLQSQPLPAIPARHLAVFDNQARVSESSIAPPSRAPPQPPTSAPSRSSKIQNRKSMPQMSRPAGPPPKGPLPVPPVPILPPIQLSSGSLRRSIERPWQGGSDKGSFEFGVSMT
ncbi:MAG: hypothetical protein LQ342_004118 [Letrouitia transgressa]|nr:MAG: hypothetical protein LQ342_004118 [Letrouitia transgressa]